MALEADGAGDDVLELGFFGFLFGEEAGADLFVDPGVVFGELDAAGLAATGTGDETAGALTTATATGAATAPEASTVSTTEPCFTLSPNFTCMAVTMPACDEGISIDALSLSTVIRLWSTLTESPTFTNSSITATSSKSPMSGTCMSICAMS